MWIVSALFLRIVWWEQWQQSHIIACEKPWFPVDVPPKVTVPDAASALRYWETLCSRWTQAKRHALGVSEVVYVGSPKTVAERDEEEMLMM
jgi:hypothetical protein